MTLPRWGLIAGLLLVVVIGLGLSPNAIAASASLAQSVPAANEVLSESPHEIRVRFTRPVDPAQSEILLVDRAGTVVHRSSEPAAADDHELVYQLPDELADGLYTVQWRSRAWEADQSISGFFPFTIGPHQQSLPGQPPETEFTAGPSLLQHLGSGLRLVGILLASGMVVAWIAAMRPAFTQSDDVSLGYWLRWGALIGVVIALAGTVLEWFFNTVSARGVYLIDERQLLPLQAGLLLLLGTFTLLPSLWQPGRGTPFRVPTLIAAAATFTPLALSGHPSDQQVGLAAASVNQWLHLMALGCLVGSVFALISAVRLVMSTSGEEPGGYVPPEATSRLLTVAIASGSIFILTGLYAFELSIGNLAGLLDTEFGNIFLRKSVFGIVLVVFSVLAVAWLHQRASQARPIRTFSPLLIALVILGTGAITAQSALPYKPAAREVLLARADRTSIQIEDGEVRAALHVTPSVAGLNRMTLDVAGVTGEAQGMTQALVRATPLNDLDGTREVLLMPQQICSVDGEIVDSNVDRLDATSTDLSVSGPWQLDLVIQHPELGNVQHSAQIDINESLPESDAPGPPLRFAGVQATLAFLAGAGFILLLTSLLRRRRSGGEQYLVQLGAAALLLFTALALWQGRVEPTPQARARNPIPRTVESVEIGRELYLEHCAMCHGEDTRGGGPAAAGLERAPTDLTADHVADHAVGDLAWWIREGIEPSMPGVGDALTDEEVWHIVNFIRSIHNPVDV